MPANPRDRNFWKVLKHHRDKWPQETYDYVYYIFPAAVIGENPSCSVSSFQILSPISKRISPETAFWNYKIVVRDVSGVLDPRDSRSLSAAHEYAEAASRYRLATGYNTDRVALQTYCHPGRAYDKSGRS